MAQGEEEKKELSTAEKGKQKAADTDTSSTINGTAEKKDKDGKGVDDDLGLPEGMPSAPILHKPNS